jgi:hypothetical protein
MQAEAAEFAGQAGKFRCYFGEKSFNRAVLAQVLGVPTENVQVISRFLNRLEDIV